MIVVAVTGPVGSGKSSALMACAREFAVAGLRVDGFVAVAGERDLEDGRASSFEIERLSDGRRLPLATRLEKGYAFDAATLAAARDWAKEWPAHLDILFLDEFGGQEARGEGHWPVWETVVGKRPGIVVLGVRATELPRIEERMGRPFDRVLSVGLNDVREELLAIASQRPDWERVGKFGAGAGALEMSVGAALHTVKFPLTGTAMSSAQAAVLTVAADGLRQRQRVVWVAFIASGLKALSPSGSRVGPMLAISMQGLLFTLATVVAGWNAFGVALGGGLVGAWASLQGFLVQYLMLGSGLEKAYSEIAKMVAGRTSLELPGLYTLVAATALLSGAFAASVALVAWRRRDRLHQRMQAWLDRSKSPTAPRRKKGWLGLSMLLPTVIVVATLLSSGSDWSFAAVTAGRALGVGLLLYAAVQRWNPSRLIGFLRRRGKWGPAYALSSALDTRDGRSPSDCG